MCVRGTGLWFGGEEGGMCMRAREQEQRGIGYRGWKGNKGDRGAWDGMRGKVRMTYSLCPSRYPHLDLNLRERLNLYLCNMWLFL